jgi:hypothetical protein
MVKRFNVGDAADRITEIAPSVKKTTFQKMVTTQTKDKKAIQQDSDKPKQKTEVSKKEIANDPFDEGYEKF